MILDVRECLMVERVKRMGSMTCSVGWWKGNRAVRTAQVDKTTGEEGTEY